MPEEPDAGSAEAAPLATEYEPGTVSLRPVVIVFAILFAAAAGFAAYSCARAVTPGGTFTDSIARYPLGSVTYLAAGRSYLVRNSDGSFLALSEVEANPGDRQQGCVIRYRPDLNAAGQSGLFRDDCHGTLFTRQGVSVQGDASPMQQHPVQVTSTTVAIRFTACLAGGSSGTPEGCRG